MDDKVVNINIANPITTFDWKGKAKDLMADGDQHNENCPLRRSGWVCEGCTCFFDMTAGFATGGNITKGMVDIGYSPEGWSFKETS